MPPVKKSPKGKRPKPIRIESEGLELDRDAWPKFEKLIKSAAKMGPKPHKGRE